MPGTGLSARHSGKQDRCSPCPHQATALSEPCFPPPETGIRMESPSPGKGGRDSICEAPAGCLTHSGSAVHRRFLSSLPARGGGRAGVAAWPWRENAEGLRPEKSPELPGTGSGFGTWTLWTPLRSWAGPRSPSPGRPAWFELSAGTEHAGGPQPVTRPGCQPWGPRGEGRGGGSGAEDPRSPGGCG